MTVACPRKWIRGSWLTRSSSHSRGGAARSADAFGATLRDVHDDRPAIVVLGLGASRLVDPGRRAAYAADAARAASARGHRTVEVVECPDAATLRSTVAAAVDAGAGLVVAVGGDGTVREAAAGSGPRDVALGVVPAGTGNLLASTLGIPTDRRSALATLRSGRVRAIDQGAATWDTDDGTGEPGGSPFLIAAGTGLDARFIAAASKDAKRRYGIGAYLVAALGQVGDLRPRPAVLTVDGVRHETEAIVVLVANAGEVIPGLLRPRLPIRPDDGRLHVFLVRGGVVGSVVGALELLAGAAPGWGATGKSLRLTGTEVAVDIAGDPPEPVEVDGDRVGSGRMTARVVPGSVRVIVPSA
jgi:diacylglycerol kinase family enzyme